MGPRLPPPPMGNNRFAMQAHATFARNAGAEVRCLAVGTGLGFWACAPRFESKAEHRDQLSGCMCKAKWPSMSHLIWE